MTRIKNFALVSLLLLSVLAPSLIQSVKAVEANDLWYAYWEHYQNYSEVAPENVSTTTTVSDTYWNVEVALVASVYEYNIDFGKDNVNFRVAVYWDSSCSLPPLRPQTAAGVTIFIEKDTGGSGLDQQKITLEEKVDPSGSSQGYGLDQRTWITSTEANRQYWGLNALAFATGLFFEPVSVATGLIGVASAFLPSGGVDYQDADYADPEAISWWDNPGYDFGDVNPVRQYCFNCFRWKQERLNPSTYYGLKVWATVSLQPGNPFNVAYIDTPPVYLQIHHNDPPATPSTPSGPTSGYVSTTYSYSTSTTDPNGDNVRYEFDWGDGSTTTGWYASGLTATASHSWSSPGGTYNVKVRAQDSTGAWSDWSSSLAVNIEPTLVTILNALGFTNIEESTAETFIRGIYRVKLYAEFAGYHAQNELSWYEVGTTQYNLIFSGPEGNFGYVDPPIVKTFTINSQFGLSFLSSERYFTETSENPDGIKHAMIYRNLDNPSMYLIGFENKLGGGDLDYNDMVISLEREYLPPATPSTPSGPTTVYRNVWYTCSTSTTDPDGDDIRYEFEFSGPIPTVSFTTGWYASGETGSVTVMWEPSDPLGTYQIRTRAQDVYELWSDWSPSLTVNILGYHDVAVTSVTASPTSVRAGETVTISVTVENQGDYTEGSALGEFNVTVYYDGNAIGTMAIMALTSGTSATVPFTWDTTGVAPGTYTIKAVARTVDDVDTTDNTYVDGTVEVYWVHDVAVINVTPVLPYGATAVYAGWQVPIEVTVENQGDFTETFNVSAVAWRDDRLSGYLIGTNQTVTNLAPEATATLTFVWNTTGVDCGTAGMYYDMMGYAYKVTGETKTINNGLFKGTVRVKYPGDVDDDGKVGYLDQFALADAYNSQYGDPNYDWRCDFDGDGKVGYLDLFILSDNYGHNAVHDVAVTSVTYALPYGATAVYPSWVINVTATVWNEGDFSETSNVTAYYDSVAIGTQNVSLNPGATETLIFVWDTTGVSPGNAGLDYTISAEASVVPDEMDTDDNTYIDDSVRVKYPGDVDGDGDVDSADFILFVGAYPSKPALNPACDFDGDGDVDIDDFVIFTGNYPHQP